MICTVPPDTFTNYPFSPNPAEVADIFHVPLSLFLSDQEAPLKSHTVQEHTSSFDLHHFNVEFQGREFDVQGITAHLCVCVAAIGFQRGPEFPYRLPTEYCVVSESIRDTVNRLMAGSS